MGHNGSTPGTPPQEPPKMMVPMIGMPVPQAFSVDSGEVNGQQVVLIRVESPMSTTVLVLDKQAATIMANRIREVASGGLSVVSDPMTVQDILRQPPQP